MEDNEIKIAILRKMLMHRWIGGKHTSVDNVPKGFPQHERGRVAELVKELMIDGFILRKPTSYGEEVSLNPNKVYEAKRMTGMI
jgi:acyl carrier protein phosphodiesterase